MKNIFRIYITIGFIFGPYSLLKSMDALSHILSRVSQGTTSVLKRPVQKICNTLHYLDENHHTELLILGMFLPFFCATPSALYHAIKNPYKPVTNALGLDHGNTLITGVILYTHLIAREPGWALTSIALRCASEAIVHYNPQIPLLGIAVATTFAQWAHSGIRISRNRAYKQRYGYADGCVLSIAVNRLKTWADKLE